MIRGAMVPVYPDCPFVNTYAEDMGYLAEHVRDIADEHDKSIEEVIFTLVKVL